MSKPLKLRKSRPLWLILATGSLLVILGLLVYLYLKPMPSSDQDRLTDPLITPVATEPSSLTFAAMGDMLAHDSVVNQARTAETYDFSGYFSSIRHLYTDSDVVFCNVETPTAGPTFGISGYPSFNAPIEFARDLNKAGCNLVNLANNHIADKGQPAIDATLDVWDDLDVLARAGANRTQQEQNTVRYFEKNGITVAFLAFADFSNSPLPHGYSVNIYHDTELVSRLMNEARGQADVVIVSTHWGTEDLHVVNDDQRQVGQRLADLGADVIIGTGPHVLQPVEWLERPDGGRTLVWYSIGNMLSSQLNVDQLTGGVAKFKVVKSEDEITISDISFDATFMSYEWSAADRAASRLHTRSNLQLKPLSEAQAETELFGASVEERSQKLREWLGGSVEVIISP